MELNDLERVALEIFTSEAGSFDIVHKIARGHIEKERETFIKNQMNVPISSNEEAGAKLRSFAEGVRLVEGVFREISQFRKREVKEMVNPAR